MSVLAKAIFDLLSMGLAILEFFVIVRLLLMLWPIRWLRPYDDIGRGLVNPFLSLVDKSWDRLKSHTLSAKGQLIVGLVVLIVLRSVFAAMANLP